jgi:hypothetical protein
VEVELDERERRAADPDRLCAIRSDLDRLTLSSSVSRERT